MVSKNEHAAAVLPFREHPHMVLKEEDISVFVANWDNKADNIRLVQKTLNIGFDSLVFLDDNPFERNIVRQFLPDVVVPDLPEDPSLYLETLAGLNLFETASFSEADLQRAEPISGGSPARADQDALHQHQRLSRSRSAWRSGSSDSTLSICPASRSSVSAATSST